MDSTEIASSNSHVRVVVFTVPCAKALRLLKALHENGIVVQAVVLRQGSPFQRIRRLVRRFGIRSTARIVKNRLKTELTSSRSRSFYRQRAYQSWACEVIPVPDLNSAGALAALKRLSPDIGVIACAGILKPEVLEGFRIGVLNIHPGITPAYRGLNPIEWAILEGTQPAVTLHLIDAGIDTGPVIEQQVVRLERGDDFDSLYRRTQDVGIGILARSLQRLQRGESLVVTQQDCRGTRARPSIPRSLRRVARQRLRERASQTED